MCIFGAKMQETIRANESWIDENGARGKNEFNVRRLICSLLRTKTSPR
jgi:hypothetical protein